MFDRVSVGFSSPRHEIRHTSSRSRSPSPGTSFVTTRSAGSPRSVLGAVIVFACVVFVLGSPVVAQQLDDKFWITDGQVTTVAEAGDRIYLGGTFEWVGPATGGFAPFDAAAGDLHPSFPKVTGKVCAIAPDGSGGWYIGGEFTNVSGVPRAALAHLNSDFSLSPWNPGVTRVPGRPTVHAVAVSGSTVYVGGRFTHVDGQPRNGIAAVHATTGSVTGWDPNADDRVYALAVSGSTVYAAGRFSQIGGLPRSRLAALDGATGAATAWNPSAAGGPFTGPYVSGVLVHGATVYACGDFTSIGGQPRNRIAALDAVTGVATAWDPNADDAVLSMSTEGTVVYVGGAFETIGGQPRSGLAALDSATGAATPWDPDPDSWALAVAVSGSTVYVGGYFENIGGQRRNLFAALDAATGTAVADWVADVGATYAYGSVDALAVDGPTVCAGGNFSLAGAQARGNLAALDVTTGEATGWDPDADGPVRSLAVSGSTIYAGGSFQTIGGQTRNGIAALDEGGAATAWDPHAVGGSVNALAVSESTVYAGGTFTEIGGQTRRLAAALDAASGAATAWDVNIGENPPDAAVEVIVLSGSTVFLGGEFNVGPVPCWNVAAFDVVTAVQPAWVSVLVSPPPVRALGVSGSTLYVGGDFTTVGLEPRSRVAALDTETGEVTAWDPHAEGGEVYALAVDGPTIYAGGSFAAIGGQPRRGVAALDATTGTAAPWDPALDAGPTGTPRVHAVRSVGSTQYLGGWFVSGDGFPHAKFAVFDSDPTSAPIVTPGLSQPLYVENTPNPFRTATTIRFALPAAARVRVDVFDVSGRRVFTPLHDKWVDAGTHRVEFAPLGFPSGVYFYRVQAGRVAESRKMLLVR